MDSTTESVSTETKTYKEGELIKGKDFIRLESPLILPSRNTPLLTQAQDFVGAINELFQEGTGATTYNGSLRAVIDDMTGAISIVVGEVPEGKTEESYTDYNYTYTAVDFSEEITTETTSGETTTKHTETFSKTVITKLYNSNGKVIMYCDYDDSTGEIKGFYDGNGVPIYLMEWRDDNG